MNVALIYQEPTCVWRRHTELYVKHNKKVHIAGQILEKQGIQVSIWNSIKTYLENMPSHAIHNELVFPAIENCFERNRAGLVPSIWELLDIPYVGSDPYAFMISADKMLFQTICEKEGLKCPRGFEISSCMSNEEIRAKLNYAEFSFPIVLKYRYGTLSYGLSFIKNIEELMHRSYQLLMEEPGSSVLCQEYIAGQEFTVPIINTGDLAQVLAVIQYVGPEENSLELYDLQWKNEFDDQVQLVPLPEFASLSQTIQKQCLALYRCIHFRDMARFDLRITDAGDIYFLEANCLPNLSYDSAFDPQSYGGAATFDDVLLNIIRSAWHRNRKRLGKWD